MTYFIRRGWKAIAGAVAGLTAANVDWVTNEVLGFDLPAAQDKAVAFVLAGLIVFLAPRNAPKRERVSTPED